jgi:HEAT repeats
MRRLLAIVCLSAAGSVGCSTASSSSSSSAPPDPLPLTQAEPKKEPDAEKKLWGTVHKGKTIRQWYDLAFDKKTNKLAREEAVQQLGLAGRAGAFALYDLLQTKDDQTSDPMAGFGYEVQPGFVRWHALVATGRMGKDAGPSAPLIAEIAVKDDVPRVRVQAAWALGWLGVRSDAVLKTLNGILKGTDYETWEPAVASLDALRPLNEDSRELLVKLAATTEDDVRSLPLNTQIAILKAAVLAKQALQKR